VFERSKSNLVRRIDPNTLLCPAEEIHCHIEADGMSLYSDAGHLATFGARGLNSIFIPMFEAMQPGRQN
jgi:hypothetical protein